MPVSAYRAQRRGGKGRSGMATREDDFVSSLFVANTHTPVLFFSSRGIVYKLKVWRLPLGAPQARGKAFVNLLPLGEGETISAVMPMPEDEASWSTLHVMFATARGGVRRNELSDFVSVNQSGKIAMKFEGEDAGDRLIGVSVCSEDQDVLLATRQGRSMRFPVATVRVFQSRASTGVRGIALAEGDEVISMSLFDSGKGIPTEDRDAYLRQSRALRQAENAAENAAENVEEEAAAADDTAAPATTLSPERFAELQAKEEFVLTVASSGFGKRTSAYEYRVTGRGGKGVELMNLAKGGEIVAAFPVLDSDQIMLVTDGGTLDPMPGRRNSHCGTGHARRPHRQRKRGRACRVGGAHRRGRCRKWQRQRREPFRNKRWIRIARVAKTPPPHLAHKGETWPQNAPGSIRARSIPLPAGTWKSCAARCGSSTSW